MDGFPFSWPLKGGTIRTLIKPVLSQRQMQDRKARTLRAVIGGGAAETTFMGCSFAHSSCWCRPGQADRPWGIKITDLCPASVAFGLSCV